MKTGMLLAYIAVIPAILYSTGSVYSALAGLAVAMILAFLEKSLLTVALCSCAAVFLAELLV